MKNTWPKIGDRFTYPPGPDVLEIRAIYGETLLTKYALCFFENGNSIELDIVTIQARGRPAANRGMNVNHHECAAEICKLLMRLPSPRKAALTIAIVRSNLFVGGGAKTEADVRKMIAEDDEAALEIWQAVHSQKN